MYGIAESLAVATLRFLPSLAVFVGVDGAHDRLFVVARGIAVGRARKKRCE